MKGLKSILEAIRRLKKVLYNLDELCQLVKYDFRILEGGSIWNPFLFMRSFTKNSQIKKNHRHIDFNDTLVKNHLDTLKILCYSVDKGNQKAKGGFTPPSLSGGFKRNGVDTMYITYSYLFQFCIFIVALVSLCYKIFKDKKK